MYLYVFHLCTSLKGTAVTHSNCTTYYNACNWRHFHNKKLSQYAQVIWDENTDMKYFLILLFIVIVTNTLLRNKKILSCVGSVKQEVSLHFKFK